MILPTTYMGSAEWYRQFLANPSTVQIEVMESFPKQTYRNRCTITTPDGPLTLSIPVKRADSKQLTKDVEISYQQRWQHQHWIALVSAYKRTPYFDYYADFFRPFYEKETKFLVDLNEGLHEVIVRLLTNNVAMGNGLLAIEVVAKVVRRLLVLRHVANLLCHAIKSDTIRTGDMPFVRIMLPWAENQYQT